MRASPVTRLDRWVARRLLESREALPVALVLWDGEEIRAPGSAPLARVRFADRRALVGLVLHAELGFGDAYAAGRIEVEGDLARVLTAFFAARERSDDWLGRLAARRWRQRSRRNTLRRSRDNVHHHYDLGNDFYRLWLDEEMAYTCAYFPTPELTLEEAQLAKLEHVCRKLRLRPRERVVEAGCGWGALALYMAERHGVSVTAYNISQAQVDFAREQARRRGLEGRVRFVQGDYRQIEGRYDAFASVGMLEHVGREHYRALGMAIDRSLRPEGRGLLHSIGRAQGLPMNEWVERRIFPGSYCPTLSEMAALLEPFGFAVLDVENLRLHYARTLEHWLERFEKHADEVECRFDRAFVRTWRLYLAGAIGSFRSSSFQLFQVAFARPGYADLPWTRDHLSQAPPPRSARP